MATRIVYGGVVDHVVVVERDDGRAGECIQVVDQAGHDVLDREATVAVYHCQRLGPHLRADGLKRGHKVGEERHQVGVGRVEGQPTNPHRLWCPALGWVPGPAWRQPLGQQDGLSEPGRGRKEHQPRHRRRVRPELVDQSLARDEPTARDRRAQLCTQDRHLASVGAAVRATHRMRGLIDQPTRSCLAAASDRAVIDRSLEALMNGCKASRSLPAATQIGCLAAMLGQPFPSPVCSPLRVR
jgi:hypothetical protein